MATNASLEYTLAEKRYDAAKTDEEKLAALEEMISLMPKHKSAENLRANLRQRYKKFKENLEVKKKKGKKSGKPGIKKHELQAVIVGLTQSGKSSLLEALTNFKPTISPIPYTTKTINLGMMLYEGVQIQIVDQPAIDSENFDQGVANGADVLLVTITTPAEINEISSFLKRAMGERIIVLNKIDLLDENEKRKLSAFMQSKKHNFVMTSCKTNEGLAELKEKIFKSFGKIRIYTKEPRKPSSSMPMILPRNATVKDVAEKIHAGFSEKVKETRVTGPSSKFPNQKVGLEHVLKDKDIIEFYFD
jgi:small GTP-binding protein